MKILYLPVIEIPMRETSFIRQNKEKWEQFEQQFEQETDPEKVSNLFIQITDDLSYARTYYPNRSVKIYLNNLAQRVFHSIYKNRVRRRRKFTMFWQDELPQKMFDARKQLLFTFILFTLSFCIGIFSSMHDPDFARFILGDEYVAMTEENIESGDPMKVYKESNEFDMFLSITVNNLQVAFFTMVFGIFFGLGTAYFIVFNGIMIGAFQYFFIERDLFWESFLTIWVHGALEVSAIVIAGTAGFTLGKGLLFPGTFTRMQAFRIHGLRAVQIFMGIAPIIVMAGINESFLTRHTDVPDLLRGLLIGVEFAFMLFYYVYYPRQKSVLGFTSARRSDEIPPDKPIDISLGKIKNNGQIFSDSFLVFRQFFWPVAGIVLMTAVAYTGVYFWQVTSFADVYHKTHVLRLTAFTEALKDVRELLTYEQVLNFNTTEGEPMIKPGAMLFLINVLSMTIINALGLYVMQLIRQKKTTFLHAQFWKYVIHNGWIIAIGAMAIHLVLLWDNGMAKLAFFIFLPGVFVALTEIVRKGKATTAVIGNFKYFFRYFLQIELLFIPLMLLSMMMACLSHSTITAINIQILTWNIPFSASIYEAIQDITTTVVLMFTTFMMIGMVVVNMALMFFSIRETETAADLQERIQTIYAPK